MIESIFTIFYEAVQKEQIEGLEFSLTAILSQLVDEMETPPRAVTKIILSHLLSGEVVDEKGDDGEKKSKKVERSGINGKGGSDNSLIPIISRGYNISKTLCMDNVDIMTRVVNQYISDVLNPIIFNESSNASNNQDVSEELEKLGNLIVAIWKAVPELLVNVLGQLEQNMSIEITPLRFMSTRVLGEITSFDAGRVNFITEYNTIYKTWIGRYRDVNPRIRIIWATSIPGFVKNQTNSSIIQESVVPFLGLLEDPDEKVRIAVCNALSNVDIDTIATIYATTVPQPLVSLANRLRDKKNSVRLAAFQAVGKIYDEAYDQIASGNPQITEVCSWIPSHVLGLLYVNDLEINERLDLVLFDYLFPIDRMGNGDSEEAHLKRSKRLLTIVKALNEESLKAFNAISSRQITVARYLNAFLNYCKQYHEANGKRLTGIRKKQKEDEEDESDDKENNQPPALNRDEIMKKIQSLIKWVSSLYPDPAKVSDHLTTFFKANDRHAFKLFGICINPDSDYKSTYDSYHSLLERLSKPSLSSSHSSIESTFKSILYRSSFIMFNKNNVSAIIKISRSTSHGVENLKDISHVVLKQIAVIQPGLMKSQSQEIASIIETASPGDEGLVDTLKTAKLLFGKFPDLVPASPSVWRALLKIAQTGNIKEAKQATNVLDFAPKKNTILAKLIEGLSDILSGPYEEVPKDFSTLLSCIAQLYYYNPEIIEPYSGLIINFLVRNILVSNSQRPANDDDPEWVDDVDENSIINHGEEATASSSVVDEHLQRKILALRIMVNRTRSPFLAPESADEVSRPILKVLMSLLVNNGELASKTNDTPPHYKSRLRLEAGIKLIKLAKTEHCLKQIGPKELSVLGTLIKDNQVQVRDRFVLKLTSLLSDGSIPDRFLCLVFFIAGESNKTLSDYSIRWIKARFARQLKHQKNNMALEHAFVRVLHVLAHSGTFEDYEEDKNEEKQLLTSLNRAAKYIIFYLKLIATEANISLLFYLSQRIKEYKDAVEEDDESGNGSSGLYTIADLAQICILQLKEVKGWSVSAWPGKIHLPTDSFKSITSSAEAKKIFNTSYIPEDIEKKLKESIRKELNLHHNARVKSEGSIEDVTNGNGSEKKSLSKKRSSLGNASIKTKKPKSHTAARFKSLTRASQEEEAAEPRRRSSRVTAKKVNYVNDDEDEGEEEEEEEENVKSDTDEDEY